MSFLIQSIFNESNIRVNMFYAILRNFQNLFIDLYIVILVKIEPVPTFHALPRPSGQT